MNHKGKMKKGKQKKGKPKKGKQSLKGVDKRGILNTSLSSAHFTHSGSSTSSLQRATRPTTVPHKLCSSDSIPALILPQPSVVSPTSQFLHLRQPVHRTLIGHLALSATRPMTLPNLPSSSYSVPALTLNPCTVLETSRFQDFRCQPIHCTSIGDSTTTATWPATLPNPLSSSYPGPARQSASLPPSQRCHYLTNGTPQTTFQFRRLHAFWIVINLSTAHRSATLPPSQCCRCHYLTNGTPQTTFQFCRLHAFRIFINPSTAHRSATLLQCYRCLYLTNCTPQTTFQVAASLKVNPIHGHWKSFPSPRLSSS
ncbi:hypothetical protein M9H77_28776 [Catharanthus roseus]|uniref:Uncharacterized protein n=1 Tax=Catharanthus roseus TaxID=4058 RepID=A0ACC0AGC9_CATRO|nr:hypothetical protein M9H77_28776 [Catharanthus roseus]